MTEPAFRGTLLLLQNRTRRDPESYRDEFLAQLEHFKASSATVAAQRVANPQYIAVLNYVCHVLHCFPKEGRTVANVVLDLLRSSKGNALPHDLRVALVKSMMLLRSKDIVTTEETFPILFMLLQERDKTIRKMILSHIVSDIRKVNMPSAKNGAQVNKKAQNFLFSVMAEDDPRQARCAEMIMIDLYRRRVWCDERTVEVMTKACFSRHTDIVRMALRFFLMQMPKISSLDDDNPDNDEDGDQDPGRAISKLKQKLKIVKKTSYRNRVLERNVRGIKRKYNKEEKEEEEFMKQHVDPIRLLRDPQQFVERLLAKLHKTSERFETRILYLNVIARTVSEHEVIHLPLYGFLERYMEPSQLHATQLLALSAMCVHPMIPPDVVEPLVKTIANHFVSDRSTPDAMTVGISTIREIYKRQPLAMTADLLKDLAEYKNQRGDKGVIMAARALIQLFRSVYPDLLPAKLRGSKAGAPGEVDKPTYGVQHVYSDIPGLELLYKAMDEENDGTASAAVSSSSSSDDDSSSSSGEWVTDSDSEVEADDVDGDFVDITDSDSGGDDDDDDDDACPQLVPASPKGNPMKKPRATASKDEEPPLKKASREEGDNSLVLSDGKSDGDSEDEGSSSGEWEEASGSDLEEDDEDEDDDESWQEVSDDGEETEPEEEEEEEGEEEEEEEEEEGDEEEEQEGQEEGADALSKALASQAATGEWFEDVSKFVADKAPKTSRAPSQTSSKVSTTSISSTRMLTDADFEKIRKLQAQNGSHQSLRGKLKDRDARSKHRQDFIHGISNDLSAHEIEHFTEKKRETDKQDKIERAQELRKASSKFEIQKKKKSKLNSTHGEHSKRGKLFQMTKRSQRVATKLKSSVADRASRAKDMKKKDIKFRIKRGWKA